MSAEAGTRESAREAPRFAARSHTLARNPDVRNVKERRGELLIMLRRVLLEYKERPVRICCAIIAETAIEV
jgi:hypothetical protein